MGLITNDNTHSVDGKNSKKFKAMQQSMVTEPRPHGDGVLEAGPDLTDSRDLILL